MSIAKPSNNALLYIEPSGVTSGHTCMDQEQIKQAEAKVEQWLADKHHRRCCKAALVAANAVILAGLTFGLSILWINELRKAGSCHRKEEKQG